MLFEGQHAVSHNDDVEAEMSRKRGTDRQRESEREILFLSGKGVRVNFP